MEVPLQDVARTPLPEGVEHAGMCVFTTLAVAKRTTDGGQVWRNFTKSTRNPGGSDPECLLQQKGVCIYRAALIGWNDRRTRRVVTPKHVPQLISIVLPKAEALASLNSLDLLNSLVARGLTEEAARDAIEEQKTSLEESAEDLQLVRQVLSVFGVEGDAETGRLRRKRVPRRGGPPGRTTMVFSAIDLVMLAKGCTYNTAHMIVYRIFRNYCKIDLSNFKVVDGEAVESLADIKCYLCQFPGQREKKTVALTLDGCVRLKEILPRSPRRLRRKVRDHLYIMQYSFDKETVKIGRSNNVETRRKQLESCHNFRMEVVSVYRQKGHLEKYIHWKLREKQSRSGVGKEWFCLTSGEAVNVIRSILIQKSRWVQGLRRYRRGGRN